ncbi:Phosphoenolpyruvate carboxykinase [GTP] [Caenorhabditis elegans]|uniref:Phosphoenolpyruvate carboxykinase [GTP] n=3 Tax=Caenorhabditis elegans TaxID=6239 RepID=O02286_CAEEL|nr:phosphoenolpyruvate carboxykinase (GTP) [Caenorhabditis elegans]CAB05600.1 phosphoenolpyruvate carboxykinase (GTP) [Caenorhabditis elegans]|eukprot:NP_001021587.1 Phosphoenolypyruvate CarboxyKinase [Caenorhabditis elegans]
MSVDPNLLTPYKNTGAANASLRQISEDAFYVVNEVVMKRLGHVPILKGDFHLLPAKVQRFIAEKAELMRPRGIFICDGSQHEADELIDKLIERGMLSKLEAYENNYICRTDPKDVARVESKTWMVTKNKYDTVTHTKEGVEPIMGHWLAPEDLATELDSRFPGCMAGRIMYVIPFSMGPVGGPLSKIGIQLTDSNYVVLSMRIMTRVNNDVWDALGNQDFVRCIHSVGLPRPVKQRVINHWPCNPERVLIAHRPPEREIWSFGSGYGGNSLLGKKCFALRIASNIAKDEGWMAEHMLIMGVTRPCGREHFIAAAFPSACGKTNLAMLEPTLPGWKVRCVGDDIAWMKFGEDGRLYAINPEAGFFGVAPGTSNKTNPMAVATFQKNSIFTNVAETANGEYFWEGLEDEIADKNVDITTWLGEKWHIGEPGVAAHPNSRFAAPANQCPIIHPDWESPQGVPIEAIIFGGRRPQGVPLIYETNSWEHGVFTGSCLKSEATAAAEFTGKTVMHDPMAMRPFMGYNFGKYLQHWLDLKTDSRKMPKIYHVNWFRKDSNNKFLWPGFGDNIRVIDWIIRRLDGEQEIGVETPIGTVPAKGSINLEGLGEVNWDELMSVPADYWKQDAQEIRKFLDEQVGEDLPEPVRAEMDAQEKRVQTL